MSTEGVAGRLKGPPCSGHNVCPWPRCRGRVGFGTSSVDSAWRWRPSCNGDQTGEDRVRGTLVLNCRPGSAPRFQGLAATRVFRFITPATRKQVSAARTNTSTVRCARQSPTSSAKHEYVLRRGHSDQEPGGKATEHYVGREKPQRCWLPRPIGPLSPVRQSPPNWSDPGRIRRRP